MSDGSATDGSDYVQKKGTLVFKPNEKNQKIKVEIKDDLDWEKDEDFLIKLLSDPKSKNVCLGNHAKTKVVINNDDSKYLFVEIIREGPMRCGYSVDKSCQNSPSRSRSFYT